MANNKNNKVSAFPPHDEGAFLAMIKNLTVVGFNDFTVGVVDHDNG